MTTPHSRARRLDGTEINPRDEYGCIVTVREQRTREVGSLHIGGKRMEALQRICDLIDLADGDWRILSYSTPQTIATDLKGKREIRNYQNAVSHNDNPEATALGRIGRLDLLDPSLLRGTGHNRRNGRRPR